MPLLLSFSLPNGPRFSPCLSLARRQSPSRVSPCREDMWPATWSSLTRALAMLAVRGLKSCCRCPLSRPLRDLTGINFPFFVCHGYCLILSWAWLDFRSCAEQPLDFPLFCALGLLWFAVFCFLCWYGTDAGCDDFVWLSCHLSPFPCLFYSSKPYHSTRFISVMLWCMIKLWLARVVDFPGKPKHVAGCRALWPVNCLYYVIGSIFGWLLNWSWPCRVGSVLLCQSWPGCCLCSYAGLFLWIGVLFCVLVALALALPYLFCTVSVVVVWWCAGTSGTSPVWLLVPGRLAYLNWYGLIWFTSKLKWQGLDCE